MVFQPKSILSTLYFIFDCNKCQLYNTKYTDNMKQLYICNVPKTFDAILKAMKPFIEKQVYEKIKLYDDSTSKQVIAEFHSYRDSITS